MKKILLASLLVMGLILSSFVPAFAAQDDWTAHSQVNSQLTDMDGTVKVVNYGKDAWCGTFGSSKLVDPNGFTWEFKLSDAKKFKGQDGFDLWYGLGLNGKTDTLGSAGFYALIKPVAADETEFAFFGLDGTTNKEYDVVKMKGDFKQKWTLQIKQNGTAWEVYINGEKQNLTLKGAADDLSVLTDGFKNLKQDGKAYPYLGVWSQPPFDNMNAAITITKMETVKDEPKAAEPTKEEPAKEEPAKEETKTEDTNPKTGDVGMISYLVMAGASAGALIIGRKRMTK